MTSDRYARQRAQFIAETREHEMTVLRDDGLYRHLRFQKPGTSIWYFDLITWPGCLVIRGDVGHGYIFRREDDMLAWFDHHRGEHEINPHYWSEKLERGCADVREFSADRFAEWCAEHAPSIDPADIEYEHEHGAIALLDAHDVTWDHEDVETWEDYKHHFLIALYAILWGAKCYHATPKPALCAACGHAVSQHIGWWCREATGAVNRDGRALICCCAATDASVGGTADGKQ